MTMDPTSFGPIDVSKIRGGPGAVWREIMSRVAYLLESDETRGICWIVDPALSLKGALNEAAAKSAVDAHHNEEAALLSECQEHANFKGWVAKLAESRKRLAESQIVVKQVQSKSTGKRGWRLRMIPADGASASPGAPTGKPPPQWGTRHHQTALTGTQGQTGSVWIKPK